MKPSKQRGVTRFFCPLCGVEYDAKTQEAIAGKEHASSCWSYPARQVEEALKADTPFNVSSSRVTLDDVRHLSPEQIRFLYQDGRLPVGITPEMIEADLAEEL